MDMGPQPGEQRFEIAPRDARLHVAVGGPRGVV